VTKSARSALQQEIRVPAHVQPYVTAVGIEKTVQFLLAFGGSYAYLSENPQERSPVAQEIGREATIALARQIGVGSLSVPTAKPFIASYFKYIEGLTTNEISRRLHTTHVTVRKWLAAGESYQLDLFGS
jgi:DNA-directed RNA polymerase specialized sigma24 family protein